MNTIDPEMTLKREEISKNTKGALVVRSIWVSLTELKVIKTYC